MSLLSEVEFGDVIGVHRGLIEHYGVYDNDNCIYEYNGINIGTTTLREFVGNKKQFFVLNFDTIHSIPQKIKVPFSTNFSSVVAPSPYFDNSIFDIILDIIKITKGNDYHLYSPNETIQRAQSRLGENKYNLFFNNCEHFAIWCKTGIHESYQVEQLLKALSAVSKAKRNVIVY